MVLTMAHQSSIICVMRYKVVIAAATLLMFVGASGASAATTSFSGIWRATDPSDGSTLVLAISPFGRVLLVDDNASACGGGFAFAFGAGTVAESTLTATVDVYCGTTLFAEGAEVTYERVGPTIVGPGGEVYHRVLAR
jgi:hypothetical protein